MAAGRPQQIPISKIRMDARTQARVQMDMEALANYTEEYKQRTKFPPVVLFLDPTGKHYWIGDGFHRVQAAHQAGHKSIAAVIKRGTVEDAAWFSLQANRTNGIRFTNADKTKAVERALVLKPKLSNKAIADHVGVSDHTVARIRGEYERQKRIPPTPERVRSDGRVYAPSQHGCSQIASTSKAPPPPSDPIPPYPDDPPPQGVIDDSLPPEPPPSDVVAEPLPDPVPSEPPPPDPDDPPPDDPTLRDKVGNAVPEGRLAEGFRREYELVELRSAVLRVKKQILDAIAACDPLYLDISANAFTIEIDNVHRWISHTRPHAICPYCWGDNRDCEACKGRGWVNEVTYKQAPAGMKVVRP